MKGEENTVAGNESNNSQNISADNTQNTCTSADTSHTQRDKTSADSSTTIFYSTANKAVQVFIPDRNSIKVKKRTRRIQTGKSKTTESQVQCDEVRLCCNCLKSMGSEGGLESVKSEDRSTYMIF